MKLRIKGDSIRIRLTRSEVAALLRDDRVEQQTVFNDAMRLVTRVSLGNADQMGAALRDHVLEITVPRDDGRAWASGDAISMETRTTLHLLVEKDFACLHSAAGEADAGDDDDSFPRPRAAST